MVAHALTVHTKDVDQVATADANTSQLINEDHSGSRYDRL